VYVVHAGALCYKGKFRFCYDRRLVRILYVSPPAYVRLPQEIARFRVQLEFNK